MIYLNGSLYLVKFIRSYQHMVSNKLMIVVEDACGNIFEQDADTVIKSSQVITHTFVCDGKELHILQSIMINARVYYRKNHVEIEEQLNNTYVSRFNQCVHYNLKSKLLGIEFGWLLPTCTGIEYVARANFMYFYGNSVDMERIHIRVPECTDSLNSNIVSAVCGQISIKSESIETIPERYFRSCKLKDISLPCSLKTISSLAFYGCRELKSIIIPSKVSVIGESAFADCVALEKVVFQDFDIGDNLRIIKTSAFSGCLALKSIRLPDGLNFMPNNMLKACRRLEYIYIPDSVFDMGDFLGAKMQGREYSNPNLQYISCTESQAEIIKQRYSASREILSKLRVRA